MVRISLVGLETVKGRFKTIREAWANAPRAIVHDAAEVLKEALQDEAPVRTGALRRGIHYRVERSGGAVAARFWDDEGYTVFVIKGTKPHEIWAGAYGGNGSKRALWWEGAAHPTPYAQHPGTEANDFPERAMFKAGPRIRAILRQTGLAIVSGDSLSGVFAEAA